jgi:hypothetical protein
MTTDKNPVPTVREALQALVARLRAVHGSDSYRAVWTLHAMHGGRYDGPTYTDELDAAEAALAAPDPAPSGAHEAALRELADAAANVLEGAGSHAFADSDCAPTPIGIFPRRLRRLRDALAAAEKLTAAAGGEAKLTDHEQALWDRATAAEANAAYWKAQADGSKKFEDAAKAQRDQALAAAEQARAERDHAKQCLARADATMKAAEAERDALKQAAERAGRSSTITRIDECQIASIIRGDGDNVRRHLRDRIAWLRQQLDEPPALQPPQGPRAEAEPASAPSAPAGDVEAWVKSVRHYVDASTGDWVAKPSAIDRAVAMLRARDAEIARLNEALRASAAGGNGAARAVAELSKLYRRSWKGGVAELDKAIYDRLQELRAEQSEAQPPAVPAGAVEPVTFKSLPVGAYFLLGAWKGRKVEPIMASNGTWTNYRHSGGADWLDPGTKVVPLAATATSAPSAPEPAGDGDVIRRHLNGMEGAARDTAEWRYYTSGLWPDSPGARCLRPGGASDVVS